MKGAVFDMDGVLIDSEPLWRRAERAAFARVGIELTDGECRETMGLRSDEVVALWHRRRPWSGFSRQQVLEDLENRVAAMIRTEGVALPGVDRTIGDLRAAGLRVALASSSSPTLIRTVLSTLGLDRAFEAVCSATEERRGKPDPAVYLTAVQRLGLRPADCVAFEDSVAGVRSATAAGLKVIAVPADEQLEDPGFRAAHLTLSSLDHFRIELLDSL